MKLKFDGSPYSFWLNKYTISKFLDSATLESYLDNMFFGRNFSHNSKLITKI